MYTHYHAHGLRQLEKFEERQAEAGAEEQQQSHNSIDTSCLEPLAYNFGAHGGGDSEAIAPDYDSCLERWWLEQRSMAPWSAELIGVATGGEQEKKKK